MLSYQHVYHAGNFTDIMKHVVLVRLLTYLSIKESPYFYLDTHAGRGLYSLNSREACKNQEFKSGINLLWNWSLQLPDLLQNYLDIVKFFNPPQTTEIKKSIQFYPGSLAIALQIQRAQDRAYATELHPGEYLHLSQLNMRNKRIFIEKTDGLKKMSALLPPFEKRGLIFIDPAFELKTDYHVVPEYISQAYKKFPTGIFCLWFPVINQSYHETLFRELDKVCQNTLHLEFEIHSHLVTGMRRCGLWIANPPFILEKELQDTFSFLTEAVYRKKAFFHINRKSDGFD